MRSSRVIGPSGADVSVAAAAGAAGIGALSAGVLVERFSARALLNVQAVLFIVVALISYRFVRRPLRAGGQTEVR